MKNRVVTIIIMGAALLTALNGWAASVDENEARATAMRFLNERAAHQAPATFQPLTVAHVQPSAVKADAADYYVLNAEDGSAFVIVAGDDRAREVLAWGDHALDVNDIPCNLESWLSHYAEQMEYLHAHPDAQVQRQAFISTLVVNPLVVCTWSQGSPYNDQCPTYKGKHCVTGCIATAMAQVMYYWRYPDELPDLPAYISRTYMLQVPALPGTTLDWDNMLDGYSYHFDAEHGEAVATLMRYCGQGASMDYGTDGSGSGCWNQMVGMQVFGYNLSARLVHRDDYSNEQWEALLQEDLAAGYPVLYSGYGDAGGHAFVVDGCTYGGYYHVNWGWEGSGNDYFAIDAFVVGGMSFQYGQEMIHNLYPVQYGVDIKPYDFESDGICYKVQGNEVAVVNREERYGSYSGAVTVPDKVSWGGVSYPVTAVAYGAFRESRSLTSVVLPSSVKTIGKYAFKNCTALTSVTLPDGLESIDYAAFYGCRNLKSISFGSHLETIGYFAFYDCRRLGSLVIPASVKTVGECAFMLCSGIKNLNIRGGAEEIGYAAFAYCSALREANLGDGMVTLGEAAFYGCYNLEDVTMGLSTDSIGPLAFVGCDLSRLVVMPELPPTVADKNAFEDYHYALTKLVVTREARDNYICDEIWTDFENLVCLEDEMVPGDVNGDGEVGIADVNALIDMILDGVASPYGDVNGDGEVNIADVNAVIDMILNE